LQAVVDERHQLDRVLSFGAGYDIDSHCGQARFARVQLVEDGVQSFSHLDSI
jgi:hypothetical protein